MITASSTVGEIAAGGFSPFSSVNNILNPFKTILGGVKRIFTNFKSVSKNKKGLITAVVIAVLWILLTLLSVLGVNYLPVKLASWLTFAQGGLRGGILGFIGGIIGKGMIASLLCSFVSRWKGSLRDIKCGFARFKFSLKGGLLGTTLVGVGSALVMFNMMAGISSPIQSMAGITGFLLSLKALGGGGFIRRLIMSITANKNGETRTKNMAKCTALLSGLSLGFAMSAVISLIPWGYMPYCLGTAAIVVGVIFGIVLRNKKEVTVQ